jgi:hypothetical protein
MIGNYFARLTGSKRNLLALLASSVVLTAGCANMSTMAPTGANPFVAPATIGGKIHGGNQPVIGATVNLWFAGQSSSAALAATTTTDSTGSFSFTKGANDLPNSGATSTYSCPLSGAGADPLVYVISRGGNTQNNGVAAQTNTAAAFIAVYGLCSTLNASNFVYMSEVTTVATMATVQQFYNPTNDNITADGTGQQKIIIANLNSTIALLANPATGLYVPSTVIPAAGGNIAAGVSVTATPEPGKVNLLANIISACVNGATSAAPACGTLFTAAVPPAANTTNINGAAFPTATDTLQALYYIFTNPSNGSTANLATLFGLAGGVGAPYQPQAAQPTDWTIGINYASTGTSSNCATGNFISSPTDITIDAQDAVWFGNAQTGGNLSAISSAGVPFQCVNFDAGSSATGGTLDSAANVWSAGGTTLYRYTPLTQAILAFPVAATPLAITADGAGNVYFTAASGGTGSLYIIPGAAAASAAVAPVQISNTVGASPLRLMADATSPTPKTTPGNIWVSSGSTFVSQVALSSAAGNLNGWITTPFTTSGNSYGVSVSRANNIFTSSIDNNNIDMFLNSSGTWAPASGWPFAATTAGISSPKGISVDGRSNTWIPNSGSSSVSAISFFGPIAISPATGFQKDPTYLNSNLALAVDQAGNVWVAGTGNNFITELVGAGVPLYAPYAVGINNGRFQSVP